MFGCGFLTPKSAELFSGKHALGSFLHFSTRFELWKSPLRSELCCLLSVGFLFLPLLNRLSLSFSLLLQFSAFNSFFCRIFIDKSWVESLLPKLFHVVPSLLTRPWFKEIFFPLAAAAHNFKSFFSNPINLFALLLIIKENYF